jgi:hypothetical protein
LIDIQIGGPPCHVNDSEPVAEAMRYVALRCGEWRRVVAIHMTQCNPDSTAAKNIPRIERFSVPALDALPIAEYLATVRQRIPHAN